MMLKKCIEIEIYNEICDLKAHVIRVLDDLYGSENYVITKGYKFIKKNSETTKIKQSFEVEEELFKKVDRECWSETRIKDDN